MSGRRDFSGKATQVFNRRVVKLHLDRGLRLTWALSDHPWTDSETGAAVRIAMTCADRYAATPRLAAIAEEGDVPDAEGAVAVRVETAVGGPIRSDLRMGADIASCNALRANDAITGMGVALHGSGFVLSPEEAAKLRLDGPDVIKPFVSGRDLLQDFRERYVIDFSGMGEDAARHANPAAYEHLVEHVLPERRLNRRDSIRTLWWRFGWERPELREALRGLKRFIATPETAKHRVFQFVDAAYLPEHRNVVIALEDAFWLGALSSRAHVVWALAAGGTLEDRPVYNKTRCFSPYPFPSVDAESSAQIRSLGEELDTHRKRRLTEHPGLTITDMYNVLEKLRSGEPLTNDERETHDKGLVSTLQRLHDSLDEAVADAYGWPTRLTDEQILDKLVALNEERANAERTGTVQWLRPEFQMRAVSSKAPGGKRREEVLQAGTMVLPWPSEYPQQVAAVRDFMLATAASMTSTEVAARFTGATVSAVEPALETLAALGLVTAFANDGIRRWKGLSKTRGSSPPPAMTGTFGPPP